MLRVGRENDRQMDRGGRSQRLPAEYSATCDERNLSGYYRTRKGAFLRTKVAPRIFSVLGREEFSARGRFFLSLGGMEEKCLFYPHDGERRATF